LKIPKSVSIGRHTIKIKRKYISDEPIIGRLNVKTFEILINKNYPTSVQQEAMIHELTHAISIIYGLQLSEQQVTVLAETIYSYLMPIQEGIMPQRDAKKQTNCKHCKKPYAFYYRGNEYYCSKNCYRKSLVPKEV